MRNFKSRKRLVTLLLAGGIALTTASCSIKKHSNAQVFNEPIDTINTIEIEEHLPEAEVLTEGIVTMTENIVELPLDITLETEAAEVVSEPISEVMRYYQEYNLTEAHFKAATLNSAAMRLGPGTDYQKVDSFCRGTILEVLGRSDNDWYLVKKDNMYYFTIGSNITMLNQIYDGMTMNDIVPNLTTAIQPTTGLNVREDATKDSKKVGYISGNRTYKVLDHLSNGWYKIDYQGHVAYVSGKYCREVYMLDGRFYQFVYAKQDCCLYDEYGNVKRYLEKYEGGTVYNEDDEKYLVWIGDDYGYMMRSDVKIAPARVINVDLSLQEVQVIDGSELIYQTDVCTGKDSTPTDKGVYTLGSETGPTVLRGPGYESPVANFAGVNGGEGFHPLGGTVFGDVDYYHNHGSHGCYRLNPETYEVFFEVTKSGDTVITHK